MTKFNIICDMVVLFLAAILINFAIKIGYAYSNY